MPSDLRDGWGEKTKQVLRDGSGLAITFRNGEADAVLMSYDTWLEGERRVSVAQGRRRDWKASEAQFRLREIREDALRHGAHALIKRWGKLDLVIAPYTWVIEALGHLGEAEYPEPDDDQRYHRTRGSE